MSIAKSTARPARHQTQRSSPASERLGTTHCTYLAAAIAEVAPDWTVELHEVGTSDETISVMPEDGDDASGPTMLLYRDGSTFHLDQLDGDEYTTIGTFEALTDVAYVLRGRLRALRSGAPTHSTTLH